MCGGTRGRRARLVTREQAALRQAARAEADTVAEVDEVIGTPSPTPQRYTAAQRQQAARRAARVARYERVREFVTQGYSQRAVAQAVGLDRDTVRADLRADGPPGIQPVPAAGCVAFPRAPLS